MLQLGVTLNRGAIQNCVAGEFPFLIGRSAKANLRLDAPGIWDVHAAINLDPESKKFVISSQGESLLLVNGIRVESTKIASGDLVQIGAAELKVMLSPAIQKRLSIREAVFWLFLAGVILGECFFILSLR
jgi:hypothetical protein